MLDYRLPDFQLSNSFFSDFLFWIFYFDFQVFYFQIIRFSYFGFSNLRVNSHYRKKYEILVMRRYRQLEFLAVDQGISYIVFNEQS